MVLKLFIKGVKKGFQEFGEIINSLINLIFLSFVYFVGVGVTSTFAKLLGKSFLNIKKQTNKKTYYEKINLSKEPKEKYYNQF